MPQVLYEDMMALQKIEKVLRLVGVNGFGFFSIDNPPSEINFLNRIWVCQARNRLSLRYHEQYKHKTRFYFKPPRRDKEACLYWRYGKEENDYIEIKSPLTSYLTEQRKNLDIAGEWKKEMGMVIAKDYGILARLKDETGDVPMREGHFYDYFVSGIRGLGTWGAAQFIDRNYTAFLNIDPTEDIQILIEVTYKNNRIFDVKDVSDKPEHYFKKENSLANIRRTISLEEDFAAN